MSLENFENVFTLNFMLSVLIVVFYLHYLDQILEIFGATPGVLPYAGDYLKIIIAGGIIFVYGISVQNFLLFWNLWLSIL